MKSLYAMRVIAVYGTTCKTGDRIDIDRENVNRARARTRTHARTHTNINPHLNVNMGVMLHKAFGIHTTSVFELN